MAQTIRVRRGTNAELIAYNLLEGELGYATDTREVYVGGASGKRSLGKVFVGATAPTVPAGADSEGRLFFDTDTDKMYLHNGTSWILVGPNELTDMSGDLDDVPDGTTYGRVVNTDLSSNRPNKLNDGTNQVTAAEARTHIDDPTQHRLILDSATGSTDLWSANMILNTINNTTAGISWQEPVRTINLVGDADGGGSAPAMPNRGDSYKAVNWGGGYTEDNVYEWNGSSWSNLGAIAVDDRFIVTATTPAGAAGSFVGHGGDIATWTAGGWDFRDPIDGTAALAVDNNSIYENDGYTYTGSAWVQFTGAGQINAGVALTKDGNTLNVELGAGVAQLPSDEVGLDLQDNVGLVLTSTNTAGKLSLQTEGITVGINIDNEVYVPDGGINEDQIATATLDVGLTGGGGTKVQVLPDASTGAGVAPVSATANGTGTKIDNLSILHTTGVLRVDLVDGGSFT